jgi:2-methylisocitrate lyase-like PEP mutase family enzyme
MSETQTKAARLAALHVPGAPLVLVNVWDVGSAKAVVAGGAQAIGTSSWSVAHANGFADGERTPRALAIDILRRIVSAVDLPVTGDLESGYGDRPEAAAETIALAIDAGAAGGNLEDSVPATGGLRETKEQVERLRRARQAADAGGGFFLNARTDVFFQRPPAEHDQAMVADALERARAYADAGASGIFVPGLADEALIARFVEASPLPVNIMVMGGAPSLSVLASLGVARVSHGPGPYLLAMKALEDAARTAHQLA